MSDCLHITILLGTCAEGIACAPVIMALRDATDIHVRVINMGPPESRLYNTLRPFGIRPDMDLGLTPPQLDVSWIMGAAVPSTTDYLRQYPTDMVLVQGDSATAQAGAMAAPFENIAVGHIKAGLRCHERCNTLQGEFHRHPVGLLADLHFVPTKAARETLLQQKVPERSILFTGSTFIDSLHYLYNGALPAVKDILGQGIQGKQLLLCMLRKHMTWGSTLQNILFSVRQMAQKIPHALVVFPLHKNVPLRQIIYAHLQHIPSVCILDSLSYYDYLSLLQSAALLITDSCGMQEEVLTLGVPMLLMRPNAPHCQAMQVGQTLLIGNDSTTMLHDAQHLLHQNAARSTAPGIEDDSLHGYEARVCNPFGDGGASARIVQALRNWKNNKSLLLTREQEFSPLYEHAADDICLQLNSRLRMTTPNARGTAD